MSRLFFTILSAALLSTQLCSAREVPLNKILDWQLFRGRGAVQTDDTTLRIFGRRMMYSTQIFKFDGSKSYSIAGEFTAVQGTKDNHVRVGIQQLDENKKPLPGGVQYIWEGPTTAKGKLINLIFPGTVWNPRVKYFRIAIHANSKLLNSGDMRAGTEMKNIRLKVK